MTLVFLFGVISYTLSTLSSIMYPVYIGFGIIGIAVIVFMTYYMRNQFNIKRLDFTMNSLAFAQKAGRMLERQNSIFKGPYRIFVLVMMAGANIMLLGVDMNAHDRFFFHSNVSFLIVVSALIGMLIRNWRIKKEVKPIIAGLEDFMEGLMKEDEITDFA